MRLILIFNFLVFGFLPAFHKKKKNIICRKKQKIFNMEQEFVVF